MADAHSLRRNAQDMGMGRINATVRDEHIEQLETTKSEADSDISDAEATRRIFDRAQAATDLRSELAELQATYEQTCAAHEQEIAQTREESAQEVLDLENQISDLRNQLTAAHTRIDTTNELVKRVEEDVTDREQEREYERRVRRANIVRRGWWWLAGVPVNKDSDE